MKRYNSYNILENGNPNPIYHAVAETLQHVHYLASDAGIDLEGMSIEVERYNLPCALFIKPYIQNCEIQ